MSYLVAIDQGTTGSTVVVVNTSGKYPEVVGRSTVDFKQHYPRTGWVEHDLNEIWQSVATAAANALQQAESVDGFSPQKIAAIGITNQRETTCVFDRETGEPLTNAIVWQCKRSTSICERLRSQGLSDEVKQRTGLVLDPYFSGSKLTWLLENDNDVAGKLKSGKAIVGTIDTYLIYRLTGNVSHVTEPSNASRTLLYNIGENKWDTNMLEILGVPSVDILPEVKNSADEFGVTRSAGFLPDGIPISGVLGDQQAALAGQTCFEAGEAKCTYGTGAFLLLNTGSNLKYSANGLLSTIAWSLNGKTTYALEGSSFIAGAAIQFLRDQLGFLTKASESEAMVKNVEAAPDLYFVPALAGLGAPHWDPNARGAFLGMTRGTTKEQLVRAALEGIAFQVKDLLEAMEKDSGTSLAGLRVDGGAAANDFLMSAQAAFCGTTVDRPVNLETTAFGAALFAGLGSGQFENLDQLKGLRVSDKLFTPDDSGDSPELVTRKLSGWNRAIAAIRAFAET